MLYDLYVSNGQSKCKTSSGTTNHYYIGLPIGALEQDPDNRPLMNIFVASKTPWYKITDGLPQYD